MQCSTGNPAAKATRIAGGQGPHRPDREMGPPVSAEAVTVWAATPACVRVNERPSMVDAAIRGDVAALAATEKTTVPLPVPAPPEVMDIQGAALAAVHAHPLCVVTLTFPVPPPAANT